MVIEFISFERPHRLGSRTTMSGMVILGELTFESVGEGRTRMRWAWEMRPSGAMRLLKPLVVFMGRRQERAIWNSLKRCLAARLRDPCGFAQRHERRQVRILAVKAGSWRAQVATAGGLLAEGEMRPAAPQHRLNRRDGLPGP